jgi:hypothetical protein
MSTNGRHERAVAQSLGFAQDAAANGDFVNALEWLRVVETVDGGLPEAWESTRAAWVDRERGEPAIAGRDGTRRELRLDD